MRKNPVAFYLIPDKLKTQEMCIKAVHNVPWQLEYLPDCFKTQEMCDKSVGAGSYILEYIPDWFAKQKQLKMRHNVKFDKWHDGYQKRKAQKVQIKEELLPVAWHSSRYWDWCMSEDEKKETEKLWA